MGITSFIKKKLGIEEEPIEDITPELEREFEMRKKIEDAESKAELIEIERQAQKVAEKLVRRKIEKFMMRKERKKPRLFNPIVRKQASDYYSNINPKQKKRKRQRPKQKRQRLMTVGEGLGFRKKSKKAYDPIGLFKR